MTTAITRDEFREEMGEMKKEFRKDMVDFFSKEILPMFDQLLLGQDRLEERIDGFEGEMRDFKNRQLTFNDWVAKKLETLEIEYLAIRHQLEEYDNFFSDPDVPEEKKKSAYKVMVIKVQLLESELKKIKKILHIS